jgi:polar amino acid transport system permease protein
MDQNLVNNILYIVKGTLVTLEYSIISVFFGLIIGILLSILKTSNSKIGKIISNIYTSIFRGTPLLIQLSFIYFCIPQLFGIRLSVFVAGILAFSLNSGAYISEIIRAGIESVDKGQIEASKALSIPKYNMVKDIIMPQAIRNILPALMNELINMLKESAIISFLGEYDLMKRAQIVAAEQYTYFFPMIIAALCYYIMVVLLTFLSSILEKKIKL